MRSNRPVTQFSNRKYREFVTHEKLKKPGFLPQREGNTHTTIKINGDRHIFRLSLRGQTIAEVFFDNYSFAGLKLYDGDFYDRLGQPSTTAMERLNGLLDELGEDGFIPMNVRAFKCKEAGHAFVGRQEGNRMPFGRGFGPVSIKPGTVELEFE